MQSVCAALLRTAEAGTGSDEHAVKEEPESGSSSESELDMLEQKCKSLKEETPPRQFTRQSEPTNQKTVQSTRDEVAAILPPKVLRLDRSKGLVDAILRDEHITLHLCKDTYHVQHAQSVIAAIPMAYIFKIGITHDPSWRFYEAPYSYTNLDIKRKEGVNYEHMLVISLSHSREVSSLSFTTHPNPHNLPNTVSAPSGTLPIFFAAIVCAGGVIWHAKSIRLEPFHGQTHIYIKTHFQHVLATYLQPCVDLIASNTNCICQILNTMFMTFEQLKKGKQRSVGGSDSAPSEDFFGSQGDLGMSILFICLSLLQALFLC
jgi:hypothetical protein